ncbi:MAG TPA: thiamine pyrophosphate-dependent enzyme, partial [Candidatus Bathyarchaeia archaeon]|nr:thiamine pyrophosphate-dependent enzyme [Candidatus Bathyarchaeia archaeon]
QLGVSHVFGVPGESALTLFDSLNSSGLETVVMANEPSVGYAADAYSRLRGLGVALVSYGVGALGMVNSVAEAYAEHSPLVVISGGPSMKERRSYPLIHHKVKTFETHQRVFAEITEYSTIIDDIETADSKIETALSIAMRTKRPVYLEIPKEMVLAEIHHPRVSTETQRSDHGALREAVIEIVDLINAAKQPVVIAGVELARLKLQHELMEFAEKTGIPIASTLLGKSVLPEDHQQSVGVYLGELGSQELAHYVANSDLQILLGGLLSDVDLGIFTARLYPEKMITATIDHVTVKFHVYPNVLLGDLMHRLNSTPNLKRHDLPTSWAWKKHDAQLKNIGISIVEVMELINEFIDARIRIVCDVGDCLFASSQLRTKLGSAFLSPAYYLNMGFAIPGAVGAQLADPSKRPLVLVGDGAFQMTGMELVTVAKLHLNPIIIVLNNRRYATLRFMQRKENSKTHHVFPLDYAGFAKLLGGQGLVAQTPHELREALKRSREAKGFALIEVKISPEDASPVLRRLSERLGEKLEGSDPASPRTLGQAAH